MSKEYPQGEFHLRNVQKLFQKFDKNHDGILSLDEFKNLLSEVDKSIKTLPATAQVASQQGYYLGRILSQMYQTKGKSWNSSDLETLNSPFLYRHMGSMANIGGEQAVVDFDNGWIGEGNMSFWLWKSVYLSKQVSLKTRILLASDWLKLWVFGRDITKF
jgi:NADH dehydrogenase